MNEKTNKMFENKRINKRILNLKTKTIKTFLSIEDKCGSIIKLFIQNYANVRL